MTSDDKTLPVSSTSNENSSTNPTRPISSIFRNRFSTASFLSFRALLPQYTVVDTLEEPPATRNPLSEVTSLSTMEPPRYSLLQRRPSSLLTRRASTERPASPHSEATSPPTMEPPRYSLLQDRQSLLSTRTASTATRINVEGDPQAHEFRYSYSYPIRLKNPWATLHLHTRDAAPGDSKSLRNQPRVPRVWSCDPVTGAVQLDLDSPQSIHHISITICSSLGGLVLIFFWHTFQLKGTIVLSDHSAGHIAFLKREFTVWDRSMDGALHSDNAYANANEIPKKNIDTRMITGRHMFPFSFPFPTQTDPVLGAASISPFPVRPRSISNSVASPTFDYGPKDTENPQKGWTRITSSSDEPSSSQKSHLDHPPSSDSMMPQTLMEKDIEPNVAYDISVRIVHGRFKTSSRIKMNIAYFPASEPLPMSAKRRQAYEAGALVPSPMDDPDGWFAFPTVKTYGMVNIDGNSLHTRADSTLYIAQPLSYTRGSVIPCFITVHCDDVDIAHLLPSTDSLAARLVRRVWHPFIDNEFLPPGMDASANFSSWAHIAVPTSEQRVVTHDVGRAKWWTPSKGIVQGRNTRYLEGEIHLGPDLQPSCGFQSFRVEYAVELLTFQTANFKPEIQQNGVDVTASKLVEITTLHRQDEPVPTAYSEPPTTYNKRRVSDTTNNMIDFNTFY